MLREPSPDISCSLRGPFCVEFHDEARVARRNGIGHDAAYRQLRDRLRERERQSLCPAFGYACLETHPWQLAAVRLARRDAVLPGEQIERLARLQLAEHGCGRHRVKHRNDAQLVLFLAEPANDLVVTRPYLGVIRDQAPGRDAMAIGADCCGAPCGRIDTSLAYRPSGRGMLEGIRKFVMVPYLPGQRGATQDNFIR